MPHTKPAITCGFTRVPERSLLGHSSRLAVAVWEGVNTRTAPVAVLTTRCRIIRSGVESSPTKRTYIRYTLRAPTKPDCYMVDLHLMPCHLSFTPQTSSKTINTVDTEGDTRTKAASVCRRLCHCGCTVVNMREGFVPVFNARHIILSLLSRVKLSFKAITHHKGKASVRSVYNMEMLRLGWATFTFHSQETIAKTLIRLVYNSTA